MLSASSLLWQDDRIETSWIDVDLVSKFYTKIEQVWYTITQLAEGIMVDL